MTQGSSIAVCGRLLGFLLVALTLAAILVALGLVFDPRYKDFPYAPLTAAIVPFVVLALLSPPANGPRALAEHVAAGTLALSLIYIVFNESFANWQSLWLCGLFAAAGLHSADGAGRARLKIRSPAASADISTL